ncbi:MAG: hypothetical protein HS115_19290 [Spirochaetales bacterium]|nr:hypothetical protein [Spirochaetales bacterium]
MSGLPEREVWQSIRPITGQHLARPSPLKDLVSADLIRWARRVHKIAYMPFGFLESLQVRGYEYLPLREDPSPILAVAHKKLHDVFLLEEYLAGRPLERFHDLTLVAQAGLFSGVYAYRDIMPAFLKKGLLRRPTIALSHQIGKILKDLTETVHANPVYREGSDIPYDEATFEAELGGAAILGLEYQQYVKFAARTTLESVARVQKLMQERNYLFLILPEGKYCHDGSIATLQDLTSFMAFRRKRLTIPVAIAYDELCPDRTGRLAAFACTHPALSPPQSRDDLPAFSQKLQHILQQQTPVLSSHLLAIACLQQPEPFSLSQLRDRFLQHARTISNSDLVQDPGLCRTDYLEERWTRFLKRKFYNWYKKTPQGHVLLPHRMARFSRSERTDHDLAWNANNIRHAWRLLGFQDN